MKKFLLSAFIFLLSVSPVHASWTTFNTTTTRLSRTDTNFDVTAFTICMAYNKVSDGEGGLGAWADKGSSNWFINATATSNMRFRVNGWTTTDGFWDISESASTFLCIAYDGSAIANDPLFCWYGASQTLTTDSNPTGTWAPTTTALRIGNDQSSAATFDGQIGDFYFYAEKFASCDEASAVGNYGWMARPKGIKAYIPMGNFEGFDYSGNGADFTTTATAVSETGPTRSSVQGGFIFLGQ